MMKIVVLRSMSKQNLLLRLTLLNFEDNDGDNAAG
jgi:hypothetical protein